MTTDTDASAPPILTSTWPHPFVPHTSLPEFLLATAGGFAARTAIVDASDGRTLSYAELADGVNRVAAGLTVRGMRRGDAFAIMAPNSPEWLIACYGAMAAGGVVSGINPLYTPDEVAAQLRDAGARFVLTVPAVLPVVREAVRRAGVQARIVVHG